MKKIVFISIILIQIAFISCQKSNNTTSGGGGSNNITNATITPSNATSYYGILTEYMLENISNGGLTPSFKYATAFFSNSATAYLNPSTFVKVNSVGINGTNFKFSSFYYVDTTYTLIFPPATWQVNGLATIPSFTYTNTNAIPTYTAYSSLPDTVHIGQSVTISITGVSGSDEVTVGINDGSNAAGHSVAQVLATGATSVTFPASSLSSLSQTNSALLSVSCQKNNVKSVNSLPMNFVSTYELNKTISIK